MQVERDAGTILMIPKVPKTLIKGKKNTGSCLSLPVGTCMVSHSQSWVSTLPAHPAGR